MNERAVSHGRALFTPMPNSEMVELEVQFTIRPEEQDDFVNKLNELINRYQK